MSKIRTPAWLCSGEGSPPGWHVVTSSLCPHVAESERAAVSPLSRWTLIRLDQGPTPRPHLNLIIFHRPHLQIPSHRGVRTLAYGGDTNIWSMTLILNLLLGGKGGRAVNGQLHKGCGRFPGGRGEGSRA